MIGTRRDLSISMGRANVIVMLISIPVVILQAAVFVWLHGVRSFQLPWNLIVFIVILLLSVALHELIHGVTWVILGGKPFSAIKFGFQWQTFTPYAHLKEPIEANAYRLGAFMPGFILGIIPYLFGLILVDSNLFLFGLIHTAAAGGDWLVLWLIRNVQGGQLVEDHPTNAGCYIIES